MMQGKMEYYNTGGWRDVGDMQWTGLLGGAVMYGR